MHGVRRTWLPPRSMGAAEEFTQHTDTHGSVSRKATPENGFKSGTKSRAQVSDFRSLKANGSIHGERKRWRRRVGKMSSGLVG